MKAEQRKEIETNKLRLFLARVKEKMQGRSLYLFAGTLVMLVAVGLIIWFWRSSVAAADSSRWVEFRDAANADDVKKYDEIIAAEKHKEKPTALLARFMKARHIMYDEGMERLGSPDEIDRNNALAKVLEGRKLYEEVANDLKEFPVLQQEAWLSCAKAEETLLGYPQARGDFNKMIDYYKKAAAIHQGSDASKSYDEKMASLSAKQQEMANFYARLYEMHQDRLLNLPRTPKFDPRGGGFPGGGFPGGGFPGGGFPGGGFPGGGFPGPID